MRYAVIMAGGSGTQLWPMSQADRPKQLIPLFDGKSLLQIAAERLEGIVEPGRRWICTGERFRDVIRQAIPSIGDAQILGEPEGRDTLAAVGFPAAIAALEDPQAVIGVFTADHLIEPVGAFAERVNLGYRVAEARAEALVTFGITPTHPATGYGYVHLGQALEGFDSVRAALKFREKPDLPTAEQYVASGEYLWNSGMFVWRASTILDCIRRYEPTVHAGLMEIAAAWKGPDRAATLKRVYPTLKKISVDFGVMERAGTDPAVRVFTVPMQVQWLDVGGWRAYADALSPDAAGNRTSGVKLVSMDASNNLVAGDRPDHLIGLIGVSDLVVVHTERATLICRKEDAERVKALHEKVGQEAGRRYL